MYTSSICKDFNFFLLHFFLVGVCAFYFCLELVLESLSYTLTCEGLDSDILNTQNNAKQCKDLQSHLPSTYVS